MVLSCKDCKYSENVHRETFITNCGKVVPPYDYNVCKITNRIINNINKKYCEANVDDIDSMDICYNCEYWIGGGDWGLSCTQEYNIALSNGFTPACNRFKRRVEWKID